VKLNTTSEALSALQNGQVDAFSTNKAILFEMGDQLPGSKVLPGSIAMESIALGVPINRPDLRSLLNQFHQSLEASGELKEIVVKSGMRGVLLK
jgi:polar amino acid transport system substrate-binding protein